MKNLTNLLFFSILAILLTSCSHQRTKPIIEIKVTNEEAVSTTGILNIMICENQPSNEVSPPMMFISTKINPKWDTKYYTPAITYMTNEIYNDSIVGPKKIEPWQFSSLGDSCFTINLQAFRNTGDWTEMCPFTTITIEAESGRDNAIYSFECEPRSGGLESITGNAEEKINPSQDGIRTFFEDFNGDLSKWDVVDDGSSYLKICYENKCFFGDEFSGSIGNPSPALLTGMRIGYLGKINSIEKIILEPGTSISFDMRLLDFTERSRKYRVLHFTVLTNPEIEIMINYDSKVNDFVIKTNDNYVLLKDADYHNVKIAIRKDYYLDFFVDDNLQFTSQEPIPENIPSGQIQIEGICSLIDNITVDNR